MKTIFGVISGVLAGLFVAIGVIVFTQLMGAGADLLGFTEWTFRYYTICLGVCLAILIGSKPAQEFWKFMGLFLLAVILVMAVGFKSFSDFAGGDQLGQMQSMASGMAMFLATVLMHVAPGGLAAFYTFVAYVGLPLRTAQTNPRG